DELVEEQPPQALRAARIPSKQRALDDLRKVDEREDRPVEAREIRPENVRLGGGELLLGVRIVHPIPSAGGEPMVPRPPPHPRDPHVSLVAARRDTRLPVWLAHCSPGYPARGHSLAAGAPRWASSLRSAKRLRLRLASFAACWPIRLDQDAQGGRDDGDCQGLAAAMVVAVDLEAAAAAEGDDDALPLRLGDPRVRNVLARNEATAH